MGTAEVEEESTLSNSEINRKRKQYKRNQALKREIKDLAAAQVRLRQIIAWPQGDTEHRAAKINSKAIRERLLAYAFLRGRSWAETEDTHMSDLPNLKQVVIQIGRFTCWSHEETIERLKLWVPRTESFPR
jgi:predicted aminopeptidase